MTDKKELKVGVEKVIVYAPKKETKSVTSTKPILNFQQKIHYAISLCKDVSKSKTGMGYSAGSYNDVQQVVKDACITARLNAKPFSTYEITDNNLMVATVRLIITDIDNTVTDEQGNEHNRFETCGDIKVAQALKGNQNDAKTSGSLYSYGYKYLLQKFFLLNIEESQDDIDFELQRPKQSTSSSEFNVSNFS